MTVANLLDLRGQTACITGAGQGAGRAIAIALATHGAAAIAINDYHKARADSVVDEIRALGCDAIAVVADVGDYASIQTSFEHMRKSIGPVTLLVNNAGNAGPLSQMRSSPLFWETRPEDWPPYFHTNLFGVMNCCHLLLPDMIAQQHGRIVTITSDAGRVGGSRLASYAAAKAGAAGFMRSIAHETGRHAITANCISLSTLEPALPEHELAPFLSSDRTQAQLSDYIIRRFGQPDDVAGLALFLCSDAAQWITGQTYAVNGGYTVSQ